MAKKRETVRIRGHRRIRADRGGVWGDGNTSKPPQEMKEGVTQRVAKIMSHRGMCSRREAERLIESGQVMVNGNVIREQGTKAKWTDEISIEGRGQSWLQSKATLLLNKPVGFVSTQAEGDQEPAYELLKQESLVGEIPDAILQKVLERPYTLHVAGRLDRESRGLLVLTQNGMLSRYLTQSGKVDKEYIVRVSRNITEADIEQLQAPTQIDGKDLLPMQVKQLTSKSIRFVLREGKKHQIRLVCRAAGLRVNDLTRTRIGPFELGDLGSAQWTYVDPSVVDNLIRSE